MRKLSARPILSTLLGATLVLGATVGGGLAAHADDDSQDPAFQQIVANVSDFLDTHGVEEATRDTLVAKLESGELLDSQNGSEPVSTSTTTTGGYEVTISTYADGSVSESRVELPTSAETPGLVTPFGVTGCSGTATSRQGCLVDRWDGVIRQSFRADFTYVTNGYDRIDSVYSSTYNVYGATSSSVTYFGISKKYENASGPARAEYRVSAQLPVFGAASYLLGLRVGASIGGQSYTS
ncbi:hypothetical protein R2Q81_11290 [Microbacterium aquimaris]|uniref:hypothetical protein n=1 Tax=Microbacterium aquimaris TaxID=459816 RepID=UPI002AD433E9|nr:hypothetical protein [Microbacterium aquimaris]MDZ8276526.1 hypothetical protein [Microbacterium aquimaris]